MAPGTSVLLVGLNPGPFGMAQTGVPFGEVTIVQGWLGIKKRVGRPACEHPKRPVLGFACHRHEISGQRFWSWRATHAARRNGSSRASSSPTTARCYSSKKVVATARRRSCRGGTRAALRGMRSRTARHGYADASAVCRGCRTRCGDPCGASACAHRRNAGPGPTSKSGEPWRPIAAGRTDEPRARCAGSKSALRTFERS